MITEVIAAHFSPSAMLGLTVAKQKSHFVVILTSTSRNNFQICTI